MELEAAPVQPGRGLIRLLVVAILACLAQVVVSQLLTQVVAAGHATLHALVALVALLPALAIAWRWPAAGLASRAPVLGLLALAVAQLTESLGAFGYGPDNDTRINGMVALHDLGLGLTALGLMLAVAGFAIGIAVAASRRQGPARLVILGGAVGIAIGGALFVKTMIGL